MSVKVLNLEVGMYQEAKAKKKSFAEVLETLDPSDQYKGTKLSELDAFERQLLAHGLVTKGEKAVALEEFFKTSTSSVLFPEFVNRNIQFGMNRGKLDATVSDIVASTSEIDGIDYRGIAIDEANTKADYARVAEGAEFPKIQIKSKEKTLTLQKIGLSIEHSYEAVRRAKVNMLAVQFQLIGRNLANKIVSEAVSVIINGDGNSNPAGSVSATTPGTITYNDLINLEMAFSMFESETLLCNKTTAIKIMQLAEFKDALIAKEFITTGKFIAPFGNRLLLNSNVPNGMLIAFNKSAGIEQLVESGSSLVEENKLVNKQLNQSVVSRTVGFAKIWAESAYYLSF